MPNGIWFDGGSDWITLSREFVHFVLDNQDDSLRALRKMYENVLLPIESFFHVVSIVN